MQSTELKEYVASRDRYIVGQAVKERTKAENDKKFDAFVTETLARIREIKQEDERRAAAESFAKYVTEVTQLEEMFNG